MRIHEAVPDGPVRGAVIVIQEAFGLNEHIAEIAERAAAAGYHAVAPDLFHRQGGVTFEYGGDFGPVLEVMMQLSDATVLADLDSALDRLHERGFADAQIGAVGFCFGGRATFLLAVERALGAAVGFYGGGIVHGRGPAFAPLAPRIASLQTPWLGLFGDDDGSIPVDEVEELRSLLVAGAPVPTEVVRYPGAPHGFHCDRRADYRPEAAADAWQRTLAWFDSHLASA